MSSGGARGLSWPGHSQVIDHPGQVILEPLWWTRRPDRASPGEPMASARTWPYGLRRSLPRADPDKG